MGRKKKIDRIAGHLLAYIATKAVKQYGYEAAISLIPKTLLIDHYISQYGFRPAGNTLIIDGRALIALINQYKDEK